MFEFDNYITVFGETLLEFLAVLLPDGQYLFEEGESFRGQALVDVEGGSKLDTGAHDVMFE